MRIGIDLRDIWDRSVVDGTFVNVEIGKCNVFLCGVVLYGACDCMICTFQGLRDCCSASKVTAKCCRNSMLVNKGSWCTLVLEPIGQFSAPHQ